MAFRHTLLLAVLATILPATLSIGGFAPSTEHGFAASLVRYATGDPTPARPSTVTPSATPDASSPPALRIAPEAPATEEAASIDTTAESSAPQVTAPPKREQPKAEETEPPAPPPTSTPAPTETLLATDQLIVFYGSPVASGLGVLGMWEPEESALRVKEMAAEYDERNGDRGATGAMDLIYGMVTAEPGKDGMHVSYLKDDVVQRYIDLAEEHDLQVFLDLQIGRANIVDEVRKIERFLENPRVHVAIDPEYAVGPHGLPIHTPGRMSGHDINEVQDYLSAFTAARNLPPKLVVIHQYIDSTIIEGDATREFDRVELVLNMDAFGPIKEKQDKYKKYANLPYAQHHSYNIFLKQDERISSSDEIIQLEPQPDVVFYQ